MVFGFCVLFLFVGRCDRLWFGGLEPGQVAAGLLWGGRFGSALWLRWCLRLGFNSVVLVAYIVVVCIFAVSCIIGSEFWMFVVVFWVVWCY